VNAHFRAHQIFHLRFSALNKLQQQVPLRAIARAFEVRPNDVRHALAKGDAIPKKRGEQHALEEDTEERRIEWINKNARTMLL
jgi:hypothetical protein